MCEVQQKVESVFSILGVVQYHLQFVDVEKINSQGGSIRCYISKQNSSRIISGNIFKVLSAEKKAGLFISKKLQTFKNKISSHIIRMKNFIKRLY